MGSRDGLAIPQELQSTGAGNLFVADTENHTIRQICPLDGQHPDGLAAIRVALMARGTAPGLTHPRM